MCMCVLSDETLRKKRKKKKKKKQSGILNIYSRSVVRIVSVQTASVLCNIHVCVHVCVITCDCCWVVFFSHEYVQFSLSTLVKDAQNDL